MKNRFFFLFLFGCAILNWANAQIYFPDSYKISQSDSILSIKLDNFQIQSTENNQVYCIDLFEHAPLGNWLQMICSYEKSSNRVKLEGFWFRGGVPKPNDYKFENLNSQSMWYVVSCMFCYLLHRDVQAIQALQSELSWLKQHQNEFEEEIFAITLFLDSIDLYEKSGSKIKIFDMKNCPYIKS